MVLLYSHAHSSAPSYPALAGYILIRLSWPSSPRLRYAPLPYPLLLILLNHLRSFHVSVHFGSAPDPAQPAFPAPAPSPAMPPSTSMRARHGHPPGPISLPPLAPPPLPPIPPAAVGPHSLFSTSLARDAMMAYAYYLYDSPGPGRTPLGLTPVPIVHSPPEDESPDIIYRNRLLPLLLALREIHPNHIPILLLLACTYYALGDLETSLAISYQILAINANYVEAMSNIGTTMKALGRIDKAYEWWWKALKIRPTYWDALDNVLGMTFTLAHDTPDDARRVAYYRQALAVCQYVQQRVLDANGRLLITLQPNEIPRLQRTVFTSGTLYATLGPDNLEHAILEYTRAIEVVIRPPMPLAEGEQYTFRDMLLAACAAGHIMCTDSNQSGVPEISGIFQGDFTARLGDPTVDFLYVVRASGEQLLHALLHAGGGVLPTPLLLPEQVSRLPELLFSRSNGAFPAVCTRGSTCEVKRPADNVRKQTNGMTSTILLTLAKRFQDNVLGGMALPGTNGTLRISTSVIILLYYLALAWTPAPSTYNNLGIVLSGITDGRMGADGELLNGLHLARTYYTAGLQMDPKHPHLLTNLGSLLKDQDVGRPWDAVEYYKRATRVNPNLPEAVCGLVNSLSSICDWRGRGAVAYEVGVDDAGFIISPGPHPQTGWITNMVNVTDTQIAQGYMASVGAPALQTALHECLRALATAYGRQLTATEVARWQARFERLARSGQDRAERRINEAGFLIRFIDWVQPRMQRQWYVRAYGKTLEVDKAVATSEANFHGIFLKPTLPKTLQPPPVPSVLPFHTFTYPLTPRVTRLIPHRSALRISYSAFAQPWLPKHVYRPPRPPIGGKINLGYISNDVNRDCLRSNHPLSHLMQSVFGMHDRNRFNVYLYTTSPWDGTAYRPRIASTVENCVDVSSWSLNTIIDHIMQHEIHIRELEVINLGGYTKGARNDVFAARPCPIQMQLMGYAGTLGAGWCDYLVCDPIACPLDTSATERWRAQTAVPTGSGRPEDEVPLDMDADIDPETDSDEWVYCEKFMYMPVHHKQSFRGDENLTVEERAQVAADTLWLDEERRRADTRKQLFPDLPQDVIIFANFNQVSPTPIACCCTHKVTHAHIIGSGQLYKNADVLISDSRLCTSPSQIDPVRALTSASSLPRPGGVGIFLVWLRILRKVPRSILWLLRFPGAGEEHLLRTAKMWAGDEVAARIRFTDVAKKDWHIFRARVADLFLDTAECNAHTIAADVLWTAASMVNATGFGDQMTVHSAEEYENRAVELAKSVRYVPHHEPSGAVLPRGEGELLSLRRNIYLNRDQMPLFDTERWTRNLEKGLLEAWRRWVEGTMYELSDEWKACEGDEKKSGCIWIRDDEPVEVTQVA
ncbi:Glycosyltransferase Family 41 protein [Trametes cinnabarina]|uniref:protein O-GlcNAc transferase n=1 Tax=Pycnoporus cinnabarinus TaxID=5643 RepID=A0A060SB34_PYCCI|nr:Glycosyltransferase Family 41 protein [Trametes cinnabarina]